jgi:hypothetical protein
MEGQATGGAGGRAPRRRRSGEGAPAPTRRRKLNLSLDPDSYRKLKTLAVWRGSTVSRLVLDQVAELLRGLVVQDRTATRAEGPGSVEDSPTIQFAPDRAAS